MNDACYELKLPNGKGILLDPYIDHSNNKLLGNLILRSMWEEILQWNWQKSMISRHIV